MLVNMSTQHRINDNALFVDCNSTVRMKRDQEVDELQLRTNGMCPDFLFSPGI